MNIETEMIEESNQDSNKTNMPDKTYISMIEEAIFSANSELKKALKTRRTYFFISLAFATPNILKYLGVFKVNIFVEVFLWILAALMLIAVFGSDASKYKEELEKLEFRKRYFDQMLNPNYVPTYFDSLVNINIDNLSEYYNLVKSHTQRSFILSLGASISGFILILTGVGFQYFFDKTDNIALLVSTSGIIVEIVSGLFFYLYNKTVRQLKEYHDSLLDVQNILLSFKLIEETNSDHDKLPLITKMIEYLVSRK